MLCELSLVSLDCHTNYRIQKIDSAMRKRDTLGHGTRGVEVNELEGVADGGDVAPRVEDVSGAGTVVAVTELVDGDGVVAGVVQVVVGVEAEQHIKHPASPRPRYVRRRVQRDPVNIDVESD